MKFTIKGELLSLNEYIRIERGNKQAANKCKKIQTMICKNASKSLYKKVDPNVLYDLKITWNVKDNKKDPDNVYFAVKFILDGMVNAGVISNDGRKNIRHISHEIYTNKDPFIVVELLDAN